MQRRRGDGDGYETLSSFFGDRVGTQPGAEPREQPREQAGEQAGDAPRGQAAPAAGEPAGAPRRPDLDPAQAALVAEACSKSGVVWVRPLPDGPVPAGGAPDRRHRLAWHVWHDGAVTVVQGGGEQDLPGPTAIEEVVVPSKDAGSRLVTFLARSEVLDPGSPRWEAAVDALTAARLNARDAAGQRERWAAAALVVRLVPWRVAATGPGDEGAPSGAAPPPGGVSTTLGRRPWHLGGRSPRRR
jgi:hypothetical protein